jgi:beta-glucosidase
LAGFAQIDLNAGERDHVTLTVPTRALARYDSTDGWTVDPGEYELLVGRSSRDIRERAVVDVE